MSAQHPGLPNLKLMASWLGTGMPSELVEHPFLSLKNGGKWVNLQQYELFLRNSIGQSVSKPM